MLKFGFVSFNYCSDASVSFFSVLRQRWNYFQNYSLGDYLSCIITQYAAATIIKKILDARMNPSLLLKSFWQHDKHNNSVNNKELLEGALISQYSLLKFGSASFNYSSDASVSF